MKVETPLNLYAFRRTVGHLPAADLDQVKEQHQIRIVLPRRTGLRYRKAEKDTIADSDSRSRQKLACTWRPARSQS